MEPLVSKPITPKEAILKKCEVIPYQVIDAFNELISINLVNGIARFNQEDIVKLTLEKMKETNIHGKKFEYSWLNVEAIYEAAGWKVEYDKPGFNENYKATFTFSIKSDTDKLWKDPTIPF